MKKYFLMIHFFIIIGIVQCFSEKPVILHAPVERMEKWNEWKFGMFIHWGPWSQTSIGSIWHMNKVDPPEVRKTRFELYKTFDPSDFNPKAWARMAKEAGMNYIVFTTKHHDGFCNWDTKFTDFKITNPKCPYSRNTNPDIVKQIVDAYRAEEFAIGFYYSHIDWHHPVAKQFSETNLSDREMRKILRARVDERPVEWEKYMQFEKGQVKELLTHFGKVDIFFFDIWWPWASYGKVVEHPGVKQDIEDLLTMMRKINSDLIINNRGVDLYGDYSTPENQIPEKAVEGYWETNMTMSEPYRRSGGGFWFKGEHAESKSMEELLPVMAEVFSKGGNFLLNIGPGPNGKFPVGAIQRLVDLGTWMRVNGEAVYATKRSPFPSSPDWGNITMKGQRLYLWIFDWSDPGRKISLPLSNKIVKSWLLNGKTPVKYAQEAGDKKVVLTLPARPDDQIVSIVAVEYEGALQVSDF